MNICIFVVKFKCTLLHNTIRNARTNVGLFSVTLVGRIVVK